MKKMNKKLTTLMLAGALCVATLGGIAVANPVVSMADDEKVAKTYKLSDVFGASKAEVNPEAEAVNLTAFTFSDEGKVTLKRDLAFAWFDGEDAAKYLSMTFAFKELNFKSVSFTIESDSAWATEDKKATNVVKFTNENGRVSVAVNDGAAVSTSITAGKDVTLALSKGEADGEFGVNLSTEGSTQKIGSFVNVGSNYAEYSSSGMKPLVITADVTDEENSEEKAVVYFKELNNQKFDNIKAKSDTDTTPVVTDTAAPVLVVNENVGGFLLGTQFALEYEKIDVLQDSNYSDTKTFYQYNLVDKTEEEREYKSLTTSTVFMDTVVYKTESGVYTEDKEAGKATTVFLEKGKEYVSIKITLGDDTFSEDEGEFAKKEYMLSWYANASALETFDNVKYLVVDKNEEGAKYNHITLGVDADGNKINVADEKLATEVETYQKLLAEVANGVYAGSNSTIYLPSIKWLLNDNNGYRNLKFTIAYKKPSSDTAQSSSNLSYNALKISVPDEGLYEFKVFATDNASNPMQYYLDGELVDVTANNIWDIEEIPAFSFVIENLGLKIDNETSTKASDRTDDEDIGEKYTLSTIKVVGASSLKSNYALFKLNKAAAEKCGLTESVLASITYKALREKMAAGLKTVENKEYIKHYLTAYSELLAEKVGGSVTAEQVFNCFNEIKESDKATTEDEYNKFSQYNWSVSSKSFTAAEEGFYVIVADFWEEELPVQRATAYQLIVVESEVDSIKSSAISWIKNNIVSVILFGIAGLMLIAIIVLLLIKPSDETMEDIDEKAEKKAKKEPKKKDEDNK